jgi:hypothetical protein
VKARGWRVSEGGSNWWLAFIMAEVRSWFVESKEFDMLIKGGNLGLRIVERSKNKQGTIFIHREELAWLVGAVEEVIELDSSEVFWDQARAGYPRIFAQQRYNRHGRFITIEEYEGRNRRGSILIPEGRHGQGWSRLISELRTARMTLWKDRKFRDSKVAKAVSGDRSYAEVVGGSKSSKVVEVSATAKTLGDREKAHHQTRPASVPVSAQMATMLEPEVKGGYQGGGPAKFQAQTTEKGARDSGLPESNTLPEPLQYPAISGLAGLEGGCESERYGLSLSVREVLQDLSNCLKDIKGQVDRGLLRVEQTFQKLEKKELLGSEGKVGDMGCRVNKVDVRNSTQEVGWIKPKKKKSWRQRANQTGLLGPKPKTERPKAPQCTGLSSSFQLRVLTRQPVQQPGQAGESSEMGAVRANGAKGSTFAGAISGEQTKGVGAHVSASLASITEAGMDGAHAGGSGQGEEASVMMLSIIPESAEGLGDELESPAEKSATLSLRSNSTESDATLGFDILTPGKSFKRSSNATEYAGELGLEEYMPANLSKQMKVFQRRASPLSKPTKSWVAERVSWNGGRDFDKASEVFPVLGDLGDIRYQEEENLVVEDSVPQSEEHQTQGIEGVSPVSKELVWNVKGIAGLSSDGQEGKLDEMLGNIVDEKYVERASSSSRVEADGFKGMRDADSLNEA